MGTRKTRIRPSLRAIVRSLIVTAALGAAGCGGPDDAPAPTDPAARGKRLFETAVGGLACADCHGGTDGMAESRPDWRPSGHPLFGVAERPTHWGGRFEGTGRLVKASLYCAARFQYRVADRLGERGREDFRVVPTSLEDREALRAYLATLASRAGGQSPPPDASRDADIDPVFDLEGDYENGERVWMATCAVCHGNEAEGGLGPSLAGDDVYDAFSFVEYVRLGSMDDADGWMPWYRTDRLSDQELADLAARWAE